MLHRNNGLQRWKEGPCSVIQVSGTGLSGMTPELLARASALPFKKKLKWFRQCRDKLRVPWEQGHKKIRIDRSNILYESMANFQRFKKWYL